MEFIDNTGHIFTLPSYLEYPIGYEYETNPYIFWIDSEYTNTLSVNTYYIKPIYVLFNKTDNFDISNLEILIDSKIYKLISSKQIQEKLESNKTFIENIELKENDFKDKLTLEDINILNINKTAYYRVSKKYKNCQIWKTNKDYYRNINNSSEEYSYTEIQNIIDSRYVLKEQDNFYILFFDSETENEAKLNFSPTNTTTAIYYWKFENNNWGKYYFKNQFEINYVLNKISLTPVLPIGYEYEYKILEKFIKTVDEYKVILENGTEKILDINNLNEDESVENINTEDFTFDYIVLVSRNLSEEEFNNLNKESEYYKLIYKEEIKNYILIPFYVIGYTKEEGTWTTNILIKVFNDEYNSEQYTHITVGGVYKDEQEELIINGKNIGIVLPKDIIRAIYQNSFYIDTINEELYNEKLKEYLLNFMVLKGEQGNLKSAISGLKWFGWGDKISLSKLFQTDNIVINQYIRDYINIKNDFIKAYNLFRNSTYISLTLRDNEELDEVNQINLNNYFWGEGKPKFENLLNKVVSVNKDGIDFYKGYYDFVLNELGLKLIALKYYYQKYFLPIHLKIKTASIEHRVFINDLKMITMGSTLYTEKPLITQDNDIYVSFSKEDNYILEYFENKITDENFNVFNNIVQLIQDNTIDGYKISEIGIELPIKFNYKSNLKEYNSNKENKVYKPEYFDCIIFISINGNKIYKKNFSFLQKFDDKNTYYDKFILFPKLLINSNFDIYYWINNDVQIDLFVNGKYYTKIIHLKEPVLNLKLGKLEYKYYFDNPINLDDEDYNQLYVTPFDQLTKNFSFKSFMWDDLNGTSPEKLTGNLISINDSDFYRKLITYNQDINDNELNKYYIQEYDFKPLINGEDILLQGNDYYTQPIYNEKYKFTCQDTQYEIENNKYWKLNIIVISDDLLDDENKPIKNRQSFWFNNYLYFYNQKNIYHKYKKINLGFIYKINDDISIKIQEIHKYNKYIHKDEILNEYNKKSKGFDYYIKFDNSEYELNQINQEKTLYIYDSDEKIYKESLYEDENLNYFIKLEDSSNINNIIIDTNEIIEDVYKYYSIETSLGIYDYIREYDKEKIILNDNTDNYILINKFNLYTKENKSWYHLLKSSVYKPNITNNKRYLNRIHLFDLYKDGKIYEYNEEEDLGQLYDKLFYIDDENLYFSDTSKYITIHKKGESKIKLYENFAYDMYLMHDDKQWYCIFISQNTLSDFELNEKYLNPSETIINIEDFELKYVKSSNRFLINRMKINWTGGINHFKKDDIIVCGLCDNKNIPFRGDVSSKWLIKPKSINMNKSSEVESNTGIAIFSNGNSNIYYERGYYTVMVRYTIDSYIQHQKEISCIMRVE